MKTHEVRQGEDLISIAQHYRICDWQELYNHEANKRLKEKRPDPMALTPGDIVYIPDLEPIILKLATDQSHKVKVKVPKAYFSTKFVDSENTPISNAPFELVVGPKTFKGTTDGAGAVEVEIPHGAKKGHLKLWPEAENPDYVWDFNVDLGSQDAESDLTGVQNILSNLGYYDAAVDDDFGPRTHAALQRFQADFGLEPSGELDAATVDKLATIAQQ